MQFVANRFERGNVDERNAKTLRRDMEIRERFLMQRINFSQDDVFRAVAAHDGAPEKIPIGLLAESTKKSAQRLRQIKDFAVGGTEFCLVRENRRKGLNLDELGHELP